MASMYRGSHRMPCVWRRAGIALTVSVVPLASMSGEANAKPSKKPKYTNRVIQFLKYIESNGTNLKSIPMIYDAHPAYPLPEVAQGLQVSDVIEGSACQSHMAKVVLALMYVACGGLDLAHNLVTPMSWGSYTDYGGNPIPNSPAAKEAAYVHALIHRWEGHNDGEFGTGFQNANYWYRATGSHEIMPELLAAAKGLAAGNPKLEQHVAHHGSEFNPTKFVSLCSQALSTKDAELLDFCNKVAAKEWRLLFDYCYTRV